MPRAPIKVHQVSETVFVAGRGLEATVNALKIKRGSDFEPRTLTKAEMGDMRATKKISVRGEKMMVEKSFEEHLKIVKAIKGKKFPCVFYYGDVT